MKSSIIKKLLFVNIALFLLGFIHNTNSQIVLSPIHDTYIQGGDNSGTNYGSESDIRIKSSDNETYCRRGLLQFDLTSVNTVTSAILRIYANTTNPYAITAFKTTDNWNESSVTWDSAPTIGAAISSTNISTEGIYYEWDITSYIQEKLAIGIVSLYLIDESIAKKNVNFNSKESGLNIPQLVITEETVNYSSIPVLADAKTYGWGSSKHVENYGTTNNLVIKYDGLSKSTINSFLKFDISNIADPREEVYLKLYADSVQRTTLTSIYDLEGNSTWSESEISGYNNPFCGERIGIYPVSGEGAISFDITNYVNKAITNNQDYITLVLKENEGAYISFNSKEADANTPEILYGDEIVTYATPVTYSGTFYIDSENGNDNNDGTSEEKAWQNISILNNKTFEAGSSILLKRGCAWNKQTLSFKGSGTTDNPIIISAYGTGNKPSLQADGVVYDVIRIFNQEYIEISDLDIQNEGATMDYLRRGIYVLADNFGSLHHLHFTNINFSNINGSDGTVNSIYGNTEDEKRSSGILLEIRGDDVQTYFDGLLIDQCYFFNVSNTGIANSSHWTTLNIDSNWDDNIVPGTSSSHYVHNFVPSKNILIKRNRFENIMSQGLIIRTAEDPVMEYNLFYYCSLGSGSDNACFNSKTSGAIWRYNESCYTQWLEGQGDGAGIDSDIRTTNTLIEYNYCHHNQYGGVITTGGRFSTSFNDNTIVRYNILVNNGHNSIRLCNRNTNAKIYNNLVYYDDASDINRLVFQHLHKDTDSGPTKTYIANNIFYTTNDNGRFVADVEWTDTREEKCTYSNNVYYGIYADDKYPEDDHKITTDPLFVDGTVPSMEIGGYVKLNEEGIPTGEVDGSFLSCFELIENSPAIDAGITNELSVLPAADYKNESIPQGSGIEIGPFEYESDDNAINLNQSNNGISVFPNPASTFINISHPTPISQISVTGLDGRIIKQYRNLNESNKIINIGNLTRGIYIIHISTSNADYETKIIVQ